ncbi:MAG: hypothetical protein DK305_000776 [Chloroflexi bacterium]|nr:MAG: hypothetical protein DK305_000776 [Chloroflexota bacterium]
MKLKSFFIASFYLVLTLFVLINCGNEESKPSVISENEIKSVPETDKAVILPPPSNAPMAPGQPLPPINSNQNIFAIEEPRLKSCLIQVVGEKRYYELRMAQPSQQEMLVIGPCMPLAQGSRSPMGMQSPPSNAPMAPGQPLPPTSAGYPVHSPPASGQPLPPTSAGYPVHSPPASGQPLPPTSAGYPVHSPPSGLIGAQGRFRDPTEIVSIKKIETTYRAATGNTNGTFKNRQSADIVLSAFGFNETGGALSFNRNSGIATDGVRLALADTFNNRILIWNSLPSDNTIPDIVLGQTNFNTNNPGNSSSQMNWPISVSLASNKLVVTDTYNDRILIWSTFPTVNAQPADIIINNTGPIGQATKRTIKWPWGIWTNGKKMVITNTMGGSALIWNSFPTSNNQPADILLTGNGNFGTPRQITSNGQSLMIGDHNSKASKDSEIGTYVFNSFPTKDEAMYDFFMYDRADPRGGWCRGAFLDDGRLALFGSTLYIYDTFPTSNLSEPSLTINGYEFTSGDYPGIAAAGDKLYISTGNGNKIVGYNSIPTRSNQDPDFAIGSPDINTNTLIKNFIIGNPVPASNGTNLLVSSDFDKKLYLWNKRPDESGVHPDAVYTIPEAPWDNSLWGDNFVLGGKKGIYIFESIPDGLNLPDKTYTDSIGNATFQEIRGIAIDDKYLYVGDKDANKIYIWEGIPDKTSNPKFIINFSSPTRMSSDGKYLAVTSTINHRVTLFKIDQLSSNATGTNVGGIGVFNLPEGVNISNNMLFVADTGNNKVAIWNDINAALLGQSFSAVISSEKREIPAIGKNSLFWPGATHYDNDYLWVGEFKFSNRLLRYSPLY